MFLWKEIYIGSDEKKFHQIRDLLGKQGIRFRAEVSDPRSRLAGDVVFRGKPAVLHEAGLSGSMVTYRIHVKKADEEKALFLMRQSL